LEEIADQDMLGVKDEPLNLVYDITKLEKYWETYVTDINIDRIKDDDRELIELQRVWLKISNLNKVTPRKQSS
jgi:hypothetical protein